MRTVQDLITFVRFHLRQRDEDLSGVRNSEIILFFDNNYTKLCSNKKLKCERSTRLLTIIPGVPEIVAPKRTSDAKSLITTLDSTFLLSGTSYVPIAIITEKEYDDYQGFLNSEEYSLYQTTPEGPSKQFIFLTSDCNYLYLFPTYGTLGDTAILYGIKIKCWGMSDFTFSQTDFTLVLPVIRDPFWELVCWQTVMDICVGDENMDSTFKKAGSKVEELYSNLALDPDKLILNKRTPRFSESSGMTATEQDSFE